VDKDNVPLPAVLTLLYFYLCSILIFLCYMFSFWAFKAAIYMKYVINRNVDERELPSLNAGRRATSPL
jgi:hypothetical protein